MVASDIEPTPLILDDSEGGSVDVCIPDHWSYRDIVQFVQLEMSAATVLNISDRRQCHSLRRRNYVHVRVTYKEATDEIY